MFDILESLYRHDVFHFNIIKVYRIWNLNMLHWSFVYINDPLYGHQPKTVIQIA